ncbi:MAG: PbpA [Desulfobacter sp.]|nr:MAG: PbpA [Desulfobacter sp.]
MNTYKKEDSWRDLQSDYFLRRRRKSFLRKFLNAMAAIIFMGGLAAGGAFLSQRMGLFNLFKESTLSRQTAPAPQAPAMLIKADIKALTRNIVFLNSIKTQFTAETEDGTATLQTRLDPRLQSLLNKRLDRLKPLTRGKPQRIAMVAMDGRTGFIKAMAGFDLADPDANPCIVSDYPAASIFKIVTASAAVDALGYTAATPVYFNGNKYTLYKRQLTEKKNKYTSRVSLASAFAESINPVFGKLGKLYLGREHLNDYAARFGFNNGPDADFKFEAGKFAVTESDYHLAELGCGFNRQTQISPVFAALMVSAVVNQGNSLIPRMVDRVSGPDGQPVYKSKKEVYKTPVRPQTAKTMVAVMKKTVSRGTARKAFRGYTRDKVLSGLTIGGKTGSLFNNKRTVKYDWFTGFGMEKNSGKILIVAVVVGHRKYIGTRAAEHARAMLKTYFTPVSGSPS